MSEELNNQENKTNEEAGLLPIEKPDMFLKYTGLLFEINRSVLHPLGLAMVFDEQGYLKILEESNPNAGLVLSPEEYMGQKNLFMQFLEKQGNARLQRRQEILGYIKQDFPVATIKMNGCPFVKYTEDGQLLSFNIEFEAVEEFISENDFQGSVVDFLNTYTEQGVELMYNKYKDTGKITDEEIVDVPEEEQ